MTAKPGLPGPRGDYAGVRLNSKMTRDEVLAEVRRVKTQQGFTNGPRLDEVCEEILQAWLEDNERSETDEQDI